MNASKPISKVLVLEDSATNIEEIKQFCDEHNLVGLRVKGDSLSSILRSNIDLGAILLSDSYGGSIERSMATAREIHAIRAELPIAIRRETRAVVDDLPPEFQRIVCAAYVISDLTPLQRLIDDYIFSLNYPSALIRGISEITESMLGSLFKGLTVSAERPCIVRDRIIFGEVFSLIPLESAWCRGYMMLQVAEQPVISLLESQKMCDAPADFRDLNSLLGELTNLVWGAFKNRYLGELAPKANQVQVPLLVNHKQKYISFGTGNPQLCFTYHLNDPVSGQSVKFHQRLVFNLSWSPEDFKEVEQDVEAWVEAGELDLF